MNFGILVEFLEINIQNKPKKESHQPGSWADFLKHAGSRAAHTEPVIQAVCAANSARPAFSQIPGPVGT
jgi:hypothetical protein